MQQRVGAHGRLIGANILIPKRLPPDCGVAGAASVVFERAMTRGCVFAAGTVEKERKRTKRRVVVADVNPNSEREKTNSGGFVRQAKKARPTADGGATFAIKVS